MQDLRKKAVNSSQLIILLILEKFTFLLRLPTLHHFSSMNNYSNGSFCTSDNTPQRCILARFCLVTQTWNLSGWYSVDRQWCLESIHTLLLKRVWIDSNLRVWIDSIKGCGSTQDVIDGPHCTYTSILLFESIGVLTLVVIKVSIRPKTYILQKILFKWICF